MEKKFKNGEKKLKIDKFYKIYKNRKILQKLEI